MSVTMNVSNGTISEISPYFASKAKGDFDVEGDVHKILSPLFTGLVAGAPIAITDQSGKTYKEDDIVSALINCCGELVDTDAEDVVEGFMTQTMRYYKPGMGRELFLNQAATKSSLPIASATIKYTAKTDVIPACKDFIAGAATEEYLQASIGYTFRAQTLGLYFLNEIVFDQFKTDVAAQFAQISQMQQIDPDVTSKFNDFQQISLTNSLIETIRIRNGATDDCDEFSFSRLFHSIMMSLIHQNPQMSGLIPFDVEQVVCPTFLTFINVSKHAHAKASAIMNAWDELDNFQNLPLSLISTKKLMKMSAIARAKKAAVAAANASQMAQMKVMTGKSNTFKFTKEQPSTKTMIKRVIKVLHKMKDVSRSENIYKTPYMTFAKASRRHPDDFNIMGKSLQNHYHPDIHLYIDTSGSISEENYESMVKACIALAQKLNINMYFNSFSHMMSTTTKLHIRDRSKRDIYREFERVPKVSGGTDYEQIWRYINASEQRKREFSLIISDFEWCPSSRPIEHPKNLYYMPCLNMDWDTMCRCAKSFGESMIRIEPSIRGRILM